MQLHYSKVSILICRCVCLCWRHSWVVTERVMGASAELFVLMTYLCVVSERLMREPELSCLCWWRIYVSSQRDLWGSLSWAVCQSQCNTVWKGTMPSLSTGSVRWRLWGWVYSSLLCVPSLSCNVCIHMYVWGWVDISFIHTYCLIFTNNKTVCWQFYLWWLFLILPFYMVTCLQYSVFVEQVWMFVSVTQWIWGDT